MGKGDMKTAKGKRVRGSYGKSRPRPASTPTVGVAPKAKKAKSDSSAKAAAKKTTVKKATTKKAATKKTDSESAE